MPADSAPMPSDEDRPETPAERIQWEAACIARGRAEIKAGLGIDGDAPDAWFEALEHDADAPFPEPGRPYPA